jgi:hypothetical protein
MMAEGTITVEECDELLRALSDRRKEKTEKEVKATQGARPVWPYVLLVVLAIMVLPVSFVSFRMIPITPSLPCFSVPIGIGLLIFWIWMLVDCISRIPCDFRLLFTTQHRYEKWIWLAIVILTGWLGSLIYFFIIRRPAKQIAPPASQQKTRPTHSEQSFRPSPQARSLKFLLIVIIILIVAPLVAGLLLFGLMMPRTYLSHGPTPNVGIGGPLLIARAGGNPGCNRHCLLDLDANRLPGSRLP